MKAIQMILACLGRVLISLPFILGGIGLLLDWGSSERNLSTALCNWFNYAEQNTWIQRMVDVFLPCTSIVLTIALVFLILGGLLVFFGIKTRFGAFLLLLTLLGYTFVFHPFWMELGEERNIQMAIFMKNLSISGGLLTLLAVGNGFFQPRKTPPLNQQTEGKCSS